MPTFNDKLKLYALGRYAFDAGLVPMQAHKHWNRCDWITFIDAHGQWLIYQNWR